MELNSSIPEIEKIEYQALINQIGKIHSDFNINLEDTQTVAIIITLIKMLKIDEPNLIEKFQKEINTDKQRKNNIEIFGRIIKSENEFLKNSNSLLKKHLKRISIAWVIGLLLGVTTIGLFNYKGILYNMFYDFDESRVLYNIIEENKKNSIIELIEFKNKKGITKEYKVMKIKGISKIGDKQKNPLKENTIIMSPKTNELIFIINK